MSTGGVTLLVEDDERFRQRLARALRDRGFEVAEVATIAEAVALVDREPPARILLDLRLGETWSLEFIDWLHAQYPDVAVTVLTGYGSIATALDAVRRGARHYLTKPAEMEQILAALGDQPVEERAGPEPSARPMSLARLEWEHINRVLTECGGNVSEAARLLGLHRRTLQRKLAKFPMPR